MTPSHEAVPASNFGMTFYGFRTSPYPSVPFSSLRAWGTLNWAEMNPAPGSYLWSDFDALVDFTQNRNLNLVFTLGRTPRWASASPDTKSDFGIGECAPPANMKYWEDFLRAVVLRAGGKIRFWENWNEPQSPDSQFYCGDISSLVELQRRAYEVIKKTNPDALVLTPAAVGGYGPSWMARFLAAGGGNYADVTAFHGYLPPSAAAETIIDVIGKFKAVFAKYSQDRKPVWDTEAGWGEDAWLPDQDMQAAFLAKFYLLHWSAGVERLYWYAYNEPKWGTLWDESNGLHKAGIAYREVYHWMQGATMTSPCASKVNVWTCNLVRKNGYRAIVVWTASSSASHHSMWYSISREFQQYRDLQGNLHQVVGAAIPISDSPTLVETATAF